MNVGVFNNPFRMKLSIASIKFTLIAYSGSFKRFSVVGLIFSTGCIRSESVNRAKEYN